MSAPIITWTTDFGEGSPYVAQMKASALAIQPAAVFVDLTHSIRPQDVRQAALVLDDVVPQFPPGTIHVVVVDPGVGSARRVLLAEMDGRWLIGPDNGCLSRLALRCPPSKIVALEERRFWRSPVSATFHGRDIMAPVAAHLSSGVAAEQFGPALDDLQRLTWAEAVVLANRIEGEVVTVDSFGNLITNITAEMLAAVPSDDSVTVRCDEHETIGIYRTYSDQPPMTLIALVGSGGKLELAIVDDSAKMMLGVGEGAKVTVQW